jgi:hypothetical protein
VPKIQFTLNGKATEASYEPGMHLSRAEYWCYIPGMAFEYLGGDPALDLVNTVDWTARGPEQDRLVEPGDLVRWAEGVGLLQRGQADRLDRAMARHPREASCLFFEPSVP